LWYGLSPFKSLKIWANQRKKRFKNELYSTNTKTTKKITFYFLTSRFFFPAPWDIYVLKKYSVQQSPRTLVLFSDLYYFKFSLPKDIRFFYVDPYVFSLVIAFLPCATAWNTFNTKLNYLLSIFSKPFFLKLKFRGKGYYVFKGKRSTVTPQFGFAHRVYFYGFSMSVKFLSKTIIFLFGLLKTDVLRFTHAFKRVKSINPFTGRGVRFAKQIIYRKTGKVSLYR